MKKTRTKNTRNLTSRVKYLEEQLIDLQLKYMDIKYMDIEQSAVKKIGRWKPEEGDIYFYVDEYGDVDSKVWGEQSWHLYNWGIGNCYQAKSEAEKAKERMLLVQEYHDFCMGLNVGNPVDWAAISQTKYFLYYDYGAAKIKTYDSLWTKYEGTTYCLDEHLLDKALERFGEEKLKIILGV